MFPMTSQPVTNESPPALTEDELARQPIGEDALNIAAELQLDTLLENPATANATVRYISAIRKSILDCPPDALTPEMARYEQLISRLYERIGHLRRTAAYNSNSNYGAKR